METAKGSVEVREPTKLQQGNARRVAESKATIPHVYLTADAEVSEALGRLGPEARLGDAVVHAAAHALGEFPVLNGAYRDGRFELYSRINVGIAVAAPDGAFVPTLFDADTKTLSEIAIESRTLESAARDGSLAAPQLAGGTFTVADVSAFAIGSYEPVIHGGQAAILAVGGVGETPVARDGKVVAGRVAQLTLACDGRLVGAPDAAGFLARVRELLEAAEPA